jgi:hypothetical protein
MSCIQTVCVCVYKYPNMTSTKLQYYTVANIVQELSLLCVTLLHVCVCPVALDDLPHTYTLTQFAGPFWRQCSALTVPT